MSENSENDNKIALKKNINLLTGCAIIVGSIVGSGIFITTKGVLQYSSSPGISLIIWLVSGIISLIGAICFTELGTLIQTPGGNYAYIKEAYGNLMAFLYTWMMVFFTFPALNAIGALTISMYLTQLVFKSCKVSTLIIKLIAALVICFLGFVSSLQMRIISKMQIAFTFTKVVAILIVIVAGIWYFVKTSIGYGENIFADWFTSKEPFKISTVSLALYNSLFAYSGWNCLNFLTNEMKDPIKNLPRAIYISIPVVIVIYLVTNTAYYVVLTPDEVLNADTVAITFSSKVFPSSVSWLTPIFIAFSTFGCLASLILGTSRIYYAAALDGNLPHVFSMISLKFLSPITSIALVVVTSLSMLLVDDLEILILYGTFSELFFTGIAISTVIYFRYSKPDLHRPIKVFIGLPIFFLMVCLFMIGLTAYQHPTETKTALGILIIGIPVYVVCVSWQKKPISIENFMNEFTIACQKIFVCSKSD